MGDMVMTDKLPIEASARGDNTHFVKCEVYNGHRHYAVCQSVLALHNAGKARPVDRECSRAINCGECPANVMKMQERTAGHALFYTPREKNDAYQSAVTKKTDVLSISSQMGWEKGGAMLGKRKTSVTRADFDVVDAESLTAAKPTSKPARPAKPAPVAKPGSGNIYADLVNQMMKKGE
jgi:hypothetical protein